MGSKDTPHSTSPLAIFNKLAVGDLIKTWQGFKNKAMYALNIKSGINVDHYEDRDELKELINKCIHAKGGDVSARRSAVELGTIYLHLSDNGRHNFHEILAQDFDIDRANLTHQLDLISKAQTTEQKVQSEIALKNALIPSRVPLLKQFNSLPDGFKFLIDMRAELLATGKKNPLLYKLSKDLKDILASWFDVGLLDLTEITWNSPAALLEKLIEYEAVHEIKSWDDLKNRLDSDRRCFAFFHNKMPTEPLIFVEVALVDKLSNNINHLLKKEGTNKTEKINTAIFYSISNTQHGLAGISLGNFLIKTVVEKLSSELKEIKHFATLSPVPGFKKWMIKRLSEESQVLRQIENIAIQEFYKCSDSNSKIIELLEGPWQKDHQTADLLKPIVLRLCALYLLKERKGNKALNPVMNFHLTNGARLERINWLADVSTKGLRQSCGIMVNYYYKLSDIEKNHENYISSCRIASTKDVKNLLGS